MKLGVASPARRAPAPRILRPVAERRLPLIPSDPTPPAPGAVAIAAPIAPSAVRAPTDRFRCVPYGATLFARACVDRQRAAGVQTAQRAGDDGGAKRGSAEWQRGLVRHDLALCRSCAVGPQIAKQLSS